MCVDANSIVDDVMRRWPATIRVFLDCGMRCVGCPIGSFHTLGEACRLHELDVDTVLRALAAATREPKQVPLA